MNYKESLQESLNRYEELKKKYDEMIGDKIFDYIRTTLPFRFLKARYIIETLALYQELNTRITCKTGEEAVTQYNDICKFKNEKDELLDHAAYMQEVIQLKNEINALVNDNPYLSANMSLPSFGRLERIIQDCLKEIPRYKELMTIAFRTNFIESCLESLNENDIALLLEKKVIKPKDLDTINLSGSEKYQHNIQYLCEITGHTEICIKSIQTKVKGTTFKNDDGTSRQDILKEMDAYMKKEKKSPELKAVAYTYTPENGTPEPAVKIMWQDKTIGGIAKDIVKDISNSYLNPHFAVELKKINGGQDGLNYGCDIELKIYSSDMLKSNTEEREEDVAGRDLS